MYMGQCYTTYIFLYNLLVKIIFSSTANNTNINFKMHYVVALQRQNTGTMPTNKLEKFLKK